ncbi:hypothetical protein ACHAXT_005334 [Thalassiosira profunda]
MAPTGVGARGKTAGGRKRPPEVAESAAGEAAAAATEGKKGVPANDIDSKIEAMLKSRTLPGRRAAAVCKVCRECGAGKGEDEFSGEQWGEKAPVCTSCEHNPPERKQCSSCGVGKTRNAYAAEQWAKGEQVCMACFLFAKPSGDEAGDAVAESAKKPAAKRQKRSSAKKNVVKIARPQERAKKGGVHPKAVNARAAAAKAGGKIDSDEEERMRKRKAKRRRREARPVFAEPGEDGLPPDLDRTVRDTPAGRITTCLCRDREKCVDIMWRYARLGEEKYVNYLHLPQHSEKDTAVGRHVRAYREALLRHLGYSEGDVVQKSHKGGAVDWKDISGNIAFAHFHPDVMETLLEVKRVSKQSKVSKWRVSREVGQKLGLAEEDKCPAPDSNDQESFFALPTYNLEMAARDVERAEEEYKRKHQEFEETNDWMATDMVTSPSEYVKKLRDLRQQQFRLMKQNEELKERMNRETAKTADAEKKTLKLRKGLDKMANRLDHWEGKTRKKRVASWRTQGVRTQGVNEEADFSELVNDAIVQAAGSSRKKTGSKGGRRWSDQRMDKAVEAKWQNPSLSNEEALRIGGFVFPRGAKSHEKDADNVTFGQRKNNLMRRLRVKGKEMEKRASEALEAMKEREAEESESEDETWAPGDEEKEEEDEPLAAEEHAAADELVDDLTGVEVSLGGFRLFF